MQFDIKFSAIELISKFLVSQQEVSTSDPAEFGFNFSVSVLLGPEKKIAVVSTDIIIVIMKTNFEVAKFQTLSVFEIPEFARVFAKTGEEEYDIPFDVEVMLKSVGLSTTRGIVFSELRGTYIHHLILPLIDLHTLIKNDRENKAGLKVEEK